MQSKNNLLISIMKNEINDIEMTEQEREEAENGIENIKTQIEPLNQGIKKLLMFIHEDDIELINSRYDELLELEDKEGLD